MSVGLKHFESATITIASRTLLQSHPQVAGWGRLNMVCLLACWLHRRLLSLRGDGGGRPSGSKQHVLVVYRPLAVSLRLQLIVRVPLRDDGSVQIGVAMEGPSPH